MVRKITLVIVIYLMATMCGCQKEDKRTNSEPISVTLSAKGYICEWQLRVDPSGEAQLVESMPDRKVSNFKVQPSQLAELQKTVSSERFFELGNGYGEVVPDSGEIDIEITQGKKNKKVSMLYLKNWEQEGNTKLPEAYRAQRVLTLLMRWKDSATKSQPSAQTVTGR